MAPYRTAATITAGADKPPSPSSAARTLYSPTWTTAPTNVTPPDEARPGIADSPKMSAAHSAAATSQRRLPRSTRKPSRKRSIDG